MDAAAPAAKRPRSARGAARVLVDMDGVICDFDKQVHDRYAELHPDLPNIPLNERKVHFYASKHYKERFGPEAAEKVKDIIESPGFFENLPPIEGAVEALRAIDALPGVSVFICTSPLTFYDYVLREKCAWVEKHLGKSWVKKIVLTKDKTIVKGDVLIDDKPNITGDESQPDWKHLLFHTGPNEHVEGPIRLLSWKRIHWEPLLREYIGTNHVPQT